MSTRAGQGHLGVEVVRAGTVATLRLAGVIDVYSVPVLAVKVEQALKGGAWSLVVSLADVDDLDAEVAVGALLSAQRRVQQGHGTMLLVDGSDQIRRAIKARGLALVLPVFGSEEAAVQFLTSWRSAP